jgi:secreted PhoX family phosphatase
MQFPRIIWLTLTASLGVISHAQTIGTFTSVRPEPQDQLMQIPSSHVFQVIAKSGDGLTAGGSMPINSDFTGYVPIAGSSENGRLSVNSEFVPGGVTVFDIQFNSTTKLWGVSASQAVDFSPVGNFFVFGTVANCSGEVTPWGTVITCEENEISTDLTGDGYVDWGWCIEIDPATRQVKDQDGNGSPDKLWALGRMKHENVKVAADSMTVYYGDDNDTSGLVFKFIADEKMKLGSGDLFVLQRTGTTGTWKSVPNSTQADRNNCIERATLAGGTDFNRVEDVDIGPDGKVYFSSTAQGRVFRFNDMGDSIVNFEIFVDSGLVAITSDSGTAPALFNGADNLAFDGEGNLWITQDSDQRHVWMARPSHTPASPSIEVFMNTPINAEPTGITFSPDSRFLFMSIQHPFGNSETMQDVTGANVQFDRDHTIVIARKENLGTPIAVEEAQATNPDWAILSTYAVPGEKHHAITVYAYRHCEVLLEASDLSGRVLVSQRHKLSPGLQTLQVDTDHLAAGVYVTVLRSENRRESVRWFK